MRLTRLFAAAATVAALAVTPAAIANASPGFAPTRDVLTFSIPTTGGTVTPVTVTANQAPSILIYPPPPPALTYTISNPPPYSPAWHGISVVVSWRNVLSGKTGDVTLRPYDLVSPDVPQLRLHSVGTAATGSGLVVATVTVLRDQSPRPPAVISVIPGLTASVV
ncbi:hypothetical protein [Jongsikchunia kroppenstedtii]|uniref:hypothetical protein n=1 Tax=Jongsikchunia kroppenstedtii TaxID=1121721 RepID=UPI00035EB8CB|nr:hypothetical protein [Jongsikchunia kroppenstedtii]